MTKESIIKAWKSGHSKAYLFDEHYRDLRRKPEYMKRRANELKKEAQHQVEAILLENYRTESKECQMKIYIATLQLEELLT